MTLLETLLLHIERNEVTKYFYLQETPDSFSGQTILKEDASRNDIGSRNKKRGLASASEQTRQAVAKSGGVAPHAMRGLQSASPEVRRRVARLGGLAKGKQRKKQTRKQSN
ncbi:MAG: hypothetical protein ACYC7D_15300 [Nitrososphaerales archaeon]